MSESLETPEKIGNTGNKEREKKIKKKKFIPNIKKASQNSQPLSGGHRLCPGCGESMILKQALSSIDNPIVTANATGCSEICFGAYPYTSFKTPWIHSLFENASSVISGVETMHKVLAKKGLLNDNQKQIKFLAIGGDGSTYDIGFQWLSGALERGHNFVYICFDNEGYMNTGYQRSGATPIHTHTNTSPAGQEIKGKTQNRKMLTDIIAAHNIPYVAQANPANFADLAKKAHRAFEVDGPAFINCLSVCPTAWKTKVEDGELRSGSRLYYLGKSYYVELIQEKRRDIDVKFIHSKFIIKAPKGVSQNALHHAINSFYKSKAIDKILPLLKKHSKIMELSPTHISFRKADRRWGSCSSTDRISLNYYLMKLPIPIIEYVIVHELAHIRHKNHSLKFWNFVKQYMPDYQQRREELRRFEKIF